MRRQISRILATSNVAKQRFPADQLDDLILAVETIVLAIERRDKPLVAGNGSAAEVL